MTRVDLLEYALEGARTRLGVLMGSLDDDEANDLERDIATIERKLGRAKRDEAEREMVGASRSALDANAIETHRKERARAFAQFELATKPYDGWGR